MPSDWEDEEGLPEGERPSEERELPEEDRGLPEMRPKRAGSYYAPTHTQIVRRRIGALVAIVVIAAAAVVALTSISGNSDSKDTGEAAAATTKRKAKAKAESHEVTNSVAQADWKPYKGSVPILEYHVLGSPPEGAPYPELYVGRTDFEKQMDWLEEKGYEAVTLEQVQEAWYHKGKLPPKPVVISFDDGYRPQYTFALPTLRKHGWAGVLNLKAEGSELYESNVKAMLAAGWELAAHTIHHLDLTELGPEELEEEVSESRKILQEEFKAPVNNFCYPAGQFDETVVEAVEAAGYTGATTEIPGFAEKDKPYELARLEILRESHVAGLAAALKTGETQTSEGGG
jgi:peptidoglycan/xylan/chitin deacetylase (PgdA/CDA1 family)